MEKPLDLRKQKDLSKADKYLQEHRDMMEPLKRMLE